MKYKSKIAFYSLLLVGAMSFSGCLANKQVEIKPNHLDTELGNLIKGDERTYSDDDEAVITALLKNSPSYAQVKRQEAVEENIVKLPNNMPLYRQPLFAQMVVFPYTSKSGVYHGYSESWIKIKEGEFVLSDPKSENQRERIFDFNDVGKK
ncbi:hypothetical protein HPMG_01127 [Helicobacter pullorum MIT 98-5489]|uniref:Lipoprotein n=1 Tax=Helicobacter pullorum MIT 98-5489 TaxID=537972 RepID=C5F076_9HELI|nr:hypothetical protein [Helicobacter pullorum]HEH5010482.1 hypothetical protein [Campylobacter coli]EEQ63670.1 hypothetical protein HPMG_01127 [Helicobacter pullorum MIT 98-5489]HEH5040467.1 hypothetical protein [Campylobacter coli]HEH5151486.1 hypothetical protein [Campylobacter coli]HEH5389219.1 hypothetical protein [Campylobacter coli]